MKITFLGTGNARGFPTFGCNSQASNIARNDPKNRRSQSAVLLETEEGNLLLDAGRPDLGHFLEAEPLKAICLSHFHSDHVLGLFAIKWGKGKKIPVYHPNVKEGFADLFDDPGILDFHVADLMHNFRQSCFEIRPVPLIHSITTQGYLIQYKDKKIAYLSDTCGLPQDTLESVREFAPDLAIIDCNQAPGKGPGSAHNDIFQVEKIQHDAHLKKTYITHIGSGMQQWLNEADNRLPDGIYEAKDHTCLYI